MRATGAIAGAHVLPEKVRPLCGYLFEAVRDFLNRVRRSRQRRPGFRLSIRVVLYRQRSYEGFRGLPVLATTSPPVVSLVSSDRLTVQLTAAALSQIQVEGGFDEQAIALRDAMRILFPEAVTLVSAARQGFMRES